MTIRSAEVSRPFLPARTDYRLEGGVQIPDMNGDDVREVLATFETYASDGAPLLDAMAHGLVQWRICRARRAAQEKAAARRGERAEQQREPASRLS